jgi:hypothetical protein
MTAALTSDRRGFAEGFPHEEFVRQANDASDAAAAAVAYRFFYPTVSMEGMMRATLAAGAEVNQSFILLDGQPHHMIFTGNSDTPYVATVLDLAQFGPAVLEMPRGNFIGLVDDHNHRWILDMGLPGPDEGRGGRYLLLPPGWDAPPPDDGYRITHCATNRIFVAVRALPVDGDVAKAMEGLRQIQLYQLDNQAEYGFVDVTEDPMDLLILSWEDNLAYWRVLGDAIADEPPLEEFRPMYGLLAGLGITAGKPFEPDDRMRRILGDAALQGRDRLLVAAFAGHRPEQAVWPDRRWEWVGLQPDTGDFETPEYLDVAARDRWFAQAIVSSPAMFRRRVGSGSLYWLAVRDGEGNYLDGSHTYRLRVPHPVPASQFWSVTVYDSITRSQVQTEAGRAAVRSSREHLTPGPDGLIDVYVGPTPPDADANWIRTRQGEGWFAYFRIYGPEEPAFVGPWRPSDFERID